jgi:predicted house-cleaning NTP pyrophosphatase (Maf/HAM1 superfamily)
MGKLTPYRLILASASTARHDLLSRAGYHFDVIPASIAEPSSAGFSDARSYVQHVAWLKATAVAARISSDPKDRPAVILAADTVGAALSAAWRGSNMSYGLVSACGAVPATCNWPGRK